MTTNKVLDVLCHTCLCMALCSEFAFSPSSEDVAAHEAVRDQMLSAWSKKQ